MGRSVDPDLDAGGDSPVFERVEEFIAVIGTIGEYPVHRVLFPTVLLGLVEERDEHLVVRYRFIGDRQTENLVGLDIDHDMQFDPATPDPPLLAHPLAPVRNLDPGAIGGDDDVLGEDRGSYGERESQTLHSTEEGGVICRLDARNECREVPNKSLHLAVGHLQEDVDTGHPLNE